jgi:hypothetical protein
MTPLRRHMLDKYDNWRHLAEANPSINRSSKSKTSVSTTCAVRTRIVAAQHSRIIILLQRQVWAEGLSP